MPERCSRIRLLSQLYIFAKRLISSSLAQSPSEVSGFFSFPRAIAASRDDNPRPVCCQKAFAEEVFFWSIIRHETPRKSSIFEKQSEFFRRQYSWALKAEALLG